MKCYENIQFPTPTDEKTGRIHFTTMVDLIKNSGMSEMFWGLPRPKPDYLSHDVVQATTVHTGDSGRHESISLRCHLKSNRPRNKILE